MLSDGLSLVGRDRELAEVRDFLGGDVAGPGSLVLDGPPGIGKTCIWDAGIDAARASGMLAAASRFQCALLKAPEKAHRALAARFGGCKSPMGYKHLAKGSYTFEVRAINAAGADRTPASATFRL
jgi:hypothetical protein